MSFETLPALPFVAQKIMALDMSQAKDQEALIPTICQCPVTIAKILSLANSAMYGSRMPITSVKDAVGRIGITLAHTAAFGIAVYTLDNTNQSASFDTERLWKHNLKTLSIMKRISASVNRNIRPTESDVALTAMLHDIGYIVFNWASPKASNEFHKEHDFTTEFSYQNEVKYFYTTHANKGAALLRHWNLPSHIVEAIEFHHDDNLSLKSTVLASLLRLAELLQNENPEFKPFVLKHLQHLALSDHDLDGIAGDLKDKGIEIVLH